MADRTFLALLFSANGFLLMFNRLDSKPPGLLARTAYPCRALVTLLLPTCGEYHGEAVFAAGVLHCLLAAGVLHCSRVCFFSVIVVSLFAMVAMMCGTQFSIPGDSRISAVLTHILVIGISTVNIYKSIHQ